MRFERAVVGAFMTVVAAVVERRLLKTIHGRGPGQTSREAEGGLAAAPEEIAEQSQG